MRKLPVNGCCLPYVVDGVAIRDLATGGIQMTRRIATFVTAALLLFGGATLATTASARDSFAVSIGVPGVAFGYSNYGYGYGYVALRSASGVFVLRPGARVLRTTCGRVLPTVRLLSLSPVRILPPLVATGVPTSTRT